MKNLKEDKGLIVGLIFGLVAGIMGNIFVTSVYRIIDKTPGGYNWLTFLVGLVAFIVILRLLFNALKN